MRRNPALKFSKASKLNANSESGFNPESVEVYFNALRKHDYKHKINEI